MPEEGNGWLWWSVQERTRKCSDNKHSVMAGAGGDEDSVMDRTSDDEESELGEISDDKDSAGMNQMQSKFVGGQGGKNYL